MKTATIKVEVPYDFEKRNCNTCPIAEICRLVRNPHDCIIEVLDEEDDR